MNGPVSNLYSELRSLLSLHASPFLYMSRRFAVSCTKQNMDSTRHLSAFFAVVSLFSLVVPIGGQLPELNAPPPLPVYKYKKMLDEDGKYFLQWNYNESHIDFEVQVSTTGYVGFGISKVPRMNPADIVMGWMIDDQIYFGDYHTTEENRYPMMDDRQDWVVKDGTEVNGTTVLRFSRPLDSCDPQDEKITGDTLFVIYSYSDADPNVTSGLVPYHGVNRGAKPIVFLETDVIPADYPPPDTFTMDFKNHMFPIPVTGSQLQCVVFNMSGVLPASHMIKFEPLIDAGNERFVYRMNLYRCNITDPTLDTLGFECETKAPLSVRSCKSIVASWSMGAEEFHFPENVGVSMGAPTDPFTYVLEIHYTNFEFTEGLTDSSGLRVTATSTPRQHEAGMLELGNVISQGWRQVLVHGEPNIESHSVCSPRCMDWGFDSDRTPMKAIGVMFKGNDVAKTIKLRHFRRQEELPWISKDDTFSNFRQSVRRFNKPVEIRGWDNLSLECTYDTSNRTTVTRGGYSRIEEMCRATLIYYPKKSFDMCLSWSSLDTLVDPATGQKVPEGNAMTFLGNVTAWDSNINRAVTKALRESDERSLCSSIIRDPAYAIDRHERLPNIRIYREPNVCAPVSSFRPASRIPLINMT